MWRFLCLFYWIDRIYSPWICAYGWGCKVTAKCATVRFEEMPLNSFPKRFNQLYASQQCIKLFNCFPSFLTVGILKSLLNFIITGVGHACLGSGCGDERTSLSVTSLYLSIGPRDWIQVIELAWLYRKCFYPWNHLASPTVGILMLGTSMCFQCVVMVAHTLSSSI